MSEAEPNWAEVRAAIGSGRIAVVSNRDDAPLQTRLETALGREVTWVRNDERRIAHLAKSIKAGTVDYVLILHSFIDHNSYLIIMRAARAAKIKPILVRRGRPATVLREIHRAVITIEDPSHD